MASVSPELVFAEFEALMPQAMDLLRAMVEINSFTANPEGVNALAKLTAEAFEPFGFKSETVQSENSAYGRHLFLNFGNPAAKPLVLVSHLDTVYPPEEEKRKGFGWLESDLEGRIYGPGTVDIKGGTVLIWMMIAVLRTLFPAWMNRFRWMIAMNASEEVMGRDFAKQVVVRCPLGTKGIFVFEGGPREGCSYHLVTARKGRAEYRIHAHGKGAHAGSNHAEGVNAIVGLAKAVQAAAAVTDYDRKLTVNVGRIMGGTVINRVPHEAFLELELRAFEPEILSEGRRGIEALGEAPFFGDACRISVECVGVSPAWPESDTNRFLLEAWAHAAAGLGLETQCVSRGGLSDANYLHRLGPTLDGLGPTGGNAHCSERSPDGAKVPEFVEPNSFVVKGTLNVCALLLAFD